MDLQKKVKHNEFYFKISHRIFLYSNWIWRIFHGILSIPQNILHIHTRCEKYPRIFRGILSILHNVVIDLNNVMSPCNDLPVSKYTKLMSPHTQKRLISLVKTLAEHNGCLLSSPNCCDLLYTGYSLKPNSEFLSKLCGSCHFRCSNAPLFSAHTWETPKNCRTSTWMLEKWMGNQCF